MVRAVYLIHFDQPVAHANHYIGYSDDLETRLDKHEKGQGARLMAVLKERGIGWQVAMIWENADKEFERELKKRKGGSKFCPICKCNHAMELVPQEPLT